MYKTAGIVLVFTVIAALIGFGGIAAGVASYAKLAFYALLLVLILLLVFGRLKASKNSKKA